MFKPGDLVSLQGGNQAKIILVTKVRDEGHIVGRLRMKDGTYTNGPRSYETERLTLVEPYRVSAEALRRLVRHETTLAELAGMNLPENCICEEHLPLCAEDLLEGLKNLSGETAERFLDGWFFPLTKRFAEPLCLKEIPTPGDSENTWRALTEEEVLGAVWASLSEAALAPVHPQDMAETVFSLQENIRTLEVLQANKALPETEKQATREEMLHFLNYWKENTRLAEADEGILATFRTYTEALCAEDHPVALEIKGYACYGGNVAFPTDWAEAERCMKRLLELNPEDAEPANCLGYINLYGRTNGGTPRYEEAFRYFSIGAFAQIYESMYKAGDMLMEGLGIPMNRLAARRLYIQVFNENAAHLARGRVDCKYADAALRIAGLFREGEGVEKSPEKAYRMLLQAECALRRRMECADYYGDEEVLEKILKEKQELLPLLPYRTGSTVFRLSEPRLLHPQADTTYSLAVRPMTDNTVRLTAKILAGDSGERRLVFVTLPECDFCALTDTLTLFAENAELTEVKKGRGIRYDDIRKEGGRWQFLCKGETVLCLKAEGFIARVSEWKE